MVPAGSIVQCQITSTTGNVYAYAASDGSGPAPEGPEDIVSQVSSILAQEGYGVVNSSVGSAAMNTLENILTVGTGFNFQATLWVQVPTAFGQAQDVLSIVQNAFYQVTGVYPTSATAPTVQTPGQTPQATGLPSADPNGIGGSDASVAAGVGKGVTDLTAEFTALLNSLKTLGIGAVVVVVVLVAIVAFSPNTREVARAVRA